MKHKCQRRERAIQIKIITALNDIQLQHKKAFLGLKIIIFKLKSSADELLKGTVAVETEISGCEDQAEKKITRAKIQRNKDQGQKEIWRTSPRDPRDLGITVVSRKRRRTEKESMRIKEIKADFFFLRVSVNGTGLCTGVTGKGVYQGVHPASKDEGKFSRTPYRANRKSAQ